MFRFKFLAIPVAIIDLPKPIQKFLVNLIIVPIRSKNTLEAYSSIWTKEGSPLIVNTKSIADALADESQIPVSFAMRYQEPSISKAIEELCNQGCNDIKVLPLYPHYAMSSYETVVEKVKEEKETNFPSLNLDIIPPFYKNPKYIEILSAKIEESIKNVEYDHLLFSYHGIPVSHLKISDTTNSHCYKVNDCCNVDSLAHSTCYKHQCLETTKKVVEKLNIGEDKHSNSFQSRLPNEPWLKPYTDSELERLAKAGKKKLVIVTPAFVTDCLETLEEIAMEGKEEFLEAGGKEYTYVPCLNEDNNWAELISRWTKDYIKLN